LTRPTPAEYIIWLCVCVLEVVEAYTSLQMYFWLYELSIFILLIPYVSIRHLKMLAPFSMLANLLTGLGLVLTLLYCFSDLPAVSDRPAIASYATLPLYFGIAIFTFEVSTFLLYIICYLLSIVIVFIQ